MKKFANKSIVIVLIFIFLLLSGFYIYKSYQSFRNYQIVKESEKYISFIKKLNELLYNVEQEHLHSAMYLGYEGKISFEKLGLMRENSDNVLNSIQKSFDTDKKFSSYSHDLKDLSHHLQYVRSRVDVISSDYNDILFKYYQHDIANLILKDIREVSDELSMGLQNLKKYLFSYIDFISYRNEIDKERSYIAYILSKSKKMSKNDFLLWDKMLSKDFNLRYKKLDHKSKGIIEAILKDNSFSHRSFTNRVEVAKGAKEGLYRLSANSWIQNENEKIKRVQSCNEVVNKYIKDNISGEVVSLKKTIINVIISIFMLMFLFYFISKLGFANNNKRKDRRKTDKGQNRAANLKEIVPQKVQTDLVSEESNEKQNKVDNSSLKESENVVKTFHLDNELRAIIDSFADKLSKKKIDFHYGIDSTIQPAFLGDFAQVKQMIVVLLNSAINVTPSRGTIIVQADKIADKKYESAIKFSIKDSGSRIKKEERRRVKSAFYLGTSDHTRSMSIRESDLTLVAENISKMGGDFDIENNVKKGSTIYITVELKKIIK